MQHACAHRHAKGHEGRSTVLIVGIAALGFLVSANNYAADPSNLAVKVQMRNVLYHFTDKIAVDIDVLQGELVPVHGNTMPTFDDKNSFTLRIRGARIVISSSSMAAVLNSHVFAARDSPLKDISLRLENNAFKIKGKLHSKG